MGIDFTITTEIARAPNEVRGGGEAHDPEQVQPGIGLRREFTKQYAALRSALEARVNRTDRQELPT